MHAWMFLGLIASSITCLGDIKINSNMYTMHIGPSSKLEVKTGWNITWKQFDCFLFFLNKVIVKLYFLQYFDAIAMKILSPKIWINEIVS